MSKQMSFITAYGCKAWKLYDDYIRYKAAIDSKQVKAEWYEYKFIDMIKQLAKHTSSLYNRALSTMPLDLLKHVSKGAAGVLLNAMNSGKFVVDGENKSFIEFYNYCMSIMSAIDKFKMK